MYSPPSRVLAGSCRAAGWSELVRKKELEEAFVEDPLHSPAEMLSWGVPLLSLGTAFKSWFFHAWPLPELCHGCVHIKLVPW